MADKFVTAHARAKKAEARVNDIFVVRQTMGEGLRDFLARFNKVRADEDDLNESLQRLTSVQIETRRDRRNDGRRDQPPRFNRERHQPYIRTSNAPPPRHAEALPRHTAPLRNERGMPLLLSAHNFCVSPSEVVYALEKLGTKVQCPQTMKSDPRTRRSSVLCEFHQERGHKTEDCIGLQQEVVRMLNEGYLKELLSDKGRANFARGRDPSQGPPKPPSPAPTIKMIIGGGDDMVINHVKFTITHKLKLTVAHERYVDLEDSIIFDKLDADGLSFPYYDALVITLRIADTDVKRIMVDDGSIACIVHSRVLMQIRLEDKIVPHCITLTGFNNAVEQTFGEILLPVLVGGVTLETTFHVMNQETTYNAIIGRP
uniref:Retrotransposon gag domain-containing protein n=1 Tax=Nicotiana tabacum TaxID=4097 RepID=A0A1S4ATV3_TOBAC|nr:PREDICTED: uncharacterized protein LOC107801221 [Nicotiana tabacum]